MSEIQTIGIGVCGFIISLINLKRYYDTVKWQEDLISKYKDLRNE